MSLEAFWNRFSEVWEASAGWLKLVLYHHASLWACHTVAYLLAYENYHAYAGICYVYDQIRYV